MNWIKEWWMNQSTELKDDEWMNELNKRMMNEWMNWIKGWWMNESTQLKEDDWLNESTKRMTNILNLRMMN